MNEILKGLALLVGIFVVLSVIVGLRPFGWFGKSPGRPAGLSLKSRLTGGNSIHLLETFLALALLFNLAYTVYTRDTHLLDRWVGLPDAVVVAAGGLLVMVVLVGLPLPSQRLARVGLDVFSFVLIVAEIAIDHGGFAAGYYLAAFLVVGGLVLLSAMVARRAVWVVGVGIVIFLVVYGRVF